jgi:hypothetical protein
MTKECPECKEEADYYNQGGPEEVGPTPTDEELLEIKKAELYDAVKTFIDCYEITCGEAIFQSDRVQEHLAEFVDKLCEIVGYKEIKE